MLNNTLRDTNIVSISEIRQTQVKSLWWEEPLDEFVEMLQGLFREHAPYFSQLEMEEVYNEVSSYALQRGKLWDDQIKLGVSFEYVEYLAQDLTGYLRQIYHFLLEDIMDRKKECSAESSQPKKRSPQITHGNVVKVHMPVLA